MYTAREGLYRALYYQLYGKSPVNMPGDVEASIAAVLRAIEAHTSGGGTFEWPLQPIDGSVVVRRK